MKSDFENITTNHLHFVNFLNAKIDNKEIRDNNLKDICLKVIE